MSTHLDLTYTLANLRRAWLYVKTNPEAFYKSYFRPQYDAFAAAEDQYLTVLRNQLNDGSYRPTHATKVYIPKKSGILRTVSLLSVEDQIVYQAFANTIADRLPRRVTRNAYKSVFAHIYAGRSSKWFYRKWTTGYRRFNAAIARAVDDEHVYAASFDLTACYDSIGHKVLVHFLERFNLNPEFSDAFVRLLSHWTAGHQSQRERRIYLGHGIPQGPLSSGLVSEVVLHHFESAGNRLPKGVRYLRYVDDIRLYARSRDELRRALINLDYISKWIGLFPQGAKIEIREVVDVENEIKTVSDVRDEVIQPEVGVDQDRVHRELNRVSRRLAISDETKFKWLLGAADPRAAQSTRLVELLRRNPHLYLPICHYFRRSPKLTRAVSRDLYALLSNGMIYFAAEAELLHATFGRVHPNYRVHFTNHCEKRWNELRGVRHAEDLKEALLRWLFAENRLSYGRINRFFTSSNFDPWLRSASIHRLSPDHMGEPSYERVLNNLMSTSSVGPALSAAHLLLVRDLSRTAHARSLNHYASAGLVEFGFLKSKSRRPSIVGDCLNEIVGRRLPALDWRATMGRKHRALEKQLITVRGYGRTDPTAFVLSLDVAMDILLHALSLHDRSTGTCNLGGLGSFIGSETSRFAQKYPKFRGACIATHSLRLEADLAHPITRTSKRPTRRIKHADLRNLRPTVAMGLGELIRSW